MEANMLKQPPLNQWLSIYDYEPAVGQLCVVNTLVYTEDGGYDFGSMYSAVYVGNGTFCQDAEGRVRIHDVYAYKLCLGISREEQEELLEKYFKNN